jgi:adenine-specific DNA-methyltransferase
MRDFLFSDSPEKSYLRLASKEQARRLGQYFTPYPVARFMAEWVQQAPRLRQVMDPAVGLGIFFRALMDVNPNFQGVFHGFDIDRSMLEQLKQLLPDSIAPRLLIHERDFLLTEDSEFYDGILCNPPYIRYKAIPEREELLRKTEIRAGVRLSPYSNLYAYFILACGRALTPGGRAAILVPSDFLYSGFGIPVKEYLLQSGLLRYLIVFEQKDSLFNEAITTSCILLLQKDRRPQQVSFLTIQRVADLEALARALPRLDRSSVPLSVVTPAAITAEEKWSRYFYDPSSSGNFHHLIPFSTVAKVMRGIACGDNRFFTFSTRKIARSGIPQSYFLPTLTRASQASRSFFSREDFYRLAT